VGAVRRDLAAVLAGFAEVRDAAAALVPPLCFFAAVVCEAALGAVAFWAVVARLGAEPLAFWEVAGVGADVCAAEAAEVQVKPTAAPSSAPRTADEKPFTIFNNALRVLLKVV
jgi:hypothetical protein